MSAGFFLVPAPPPPSWPRAPPIRPVRGEGVVSPCLSAPPRLARQCVVQRPRLARHFVFRTLVYRLPSPLTKSLLSGGGLSNRVVATRLERVCRVCPPGGCDTGTCALRVPRVSWSGHVRIAITGLWWRLDGHSHRSNYFHYAITFIVFLTLLRIDHMTNFLLFRLLCRQCLFFSFLVFDDASTD
jgi:hypothetical protein